jgi:hypothetical protein
MSEKHIIWDILWVITHPRRSARAFTVVTETIDKEVTQTMETLGIPEPEDKGDKE